MERKFKVGDVITNKNFPEHAQVVDIGSRFYVLEQHAEDNGGSHFFYIAESCENVDKWFVKTNESLGVIPYVGNI
jgi:hypothetical protein